MSPTMPSSDSFWTIKPVYPNKEWGYGMFDMQGVFDRIRETYSPRSDEDYEEYRVNNLFIRMPKYRHNRTINWKKAY